MHDGGVESEFTCFMQEHTVENLACSGAEAKAHIGQTKCCVGARNFGLDALDCFKRCDAVFTQIFVTGSDGECECVKDEIAVREAVALCRNLCEAMCHFHLPFNITGLAALINQKTNDCSSVIASQGEDAIKTASWLFAIFQVGRVQDAATTGVSKTSLHHLWFGGVKNKWHACLACELGSDDVHVDSAIATHIVNTDVENV
ncbi:unannotated protein [freshwater metagenome]|uniref:Unannotated protein n=1 Tax=freshwater metagenome TaxID=449393 RepID=A0A6J6HZ33_9ZZZZ